MNRLIHLAVVALMVFAFASPTWAQAPRHLDQGTFIDGLAGRNMSDLLGHLVETEPNPDEVFNTQIEIAQYTMRADDPALNQDQRRRAIEGMIETTIRLIESHPDHEQRPVWQTDLAERYFERKLRVIGQSAAPFFEFGVSTAEQQRLVNESMADIFIHLAQADVRFRQLEDRLSRDEEQRRTLVNTGQWARMFETYWENKTKYYLATAAFYTALLDDSHPYYQNLGDARVPLQRNDVEEERRRLLGLAIDELEPLTSPDNAQISQAARMVCISLKGRAQLHRGDYDAAMNTLDRVIEERQSNMTDLLSQLARALAMHRAGQHGAAEELLLTLDRHPWGHSSLPMRLLVKDLLHRVLMDLAMQTPQQQRETAIGEAYDPYFDLLAAVRRSDDSSIAAQATNLENFIYRRWQDNLDPDVSHDDLPPAVIMGIGTALRRDGQRLVQQASAARRENRDRAAQDLTDQAVNVLKEAIDMLQPLLERDNILPAVRSRALKNLGWATYLSGPFDPETVLAAAKDWTRLADELPEQPEAERAIELAVNELARFYFRTPGLEGYEQAFETALGVLFEKFPTTTFADDFRLSYVSQVLMPRGNYELASQIASGVPFNHPTYFEARREMLYASLELYLLEEDTGARSVMRGEIVDAAEQLRDEADGVMERHPAERLPDAVASLLENPGDRLADLSADQLAELRRLGTAMSAAGHSRIIMAQLLEDDMNTDQALELLEGFEDRFIADRDLAREGVSRRISVHITAGNVPEAGAEAERMMDRFEDDAVGTVNQVVNSLESQIDSLRRQLQETRGSARRDRLQQRITTLSSVLVTLTEQLQDWAMRQNYSTEEMLPFRMIRVKALCLAGQGEQAVQQAQVLLESYPQDAQVIHYMGEALYTRGMNNNSADDLTAAVTRHFDRLISGLDETSELFWHAWMRRLQVMDHLNHSVNDIPVRVNGLRRMDPGLGGEPYRSALQYLYLKHD